MHKYSFSNILGNNDFLGLRGSKQDFGTYKPASSRQLLQCVQIRLLRNKLRIFGITLTLLEHNISWRIVGYRALNHVVTSLKIAN